MSELLSARAGFEVKLGKQTRNFRIPIQIIFTCVRLGRNCGTIFGISGLEPAREKSQTRQADVEGVTFCEVHRVRKKVRNLVASVASINFIICMNVENTRLKCFAWSFDCCYDCSNDETWGKLHTSEFLHLVLASKAWAWAVK